MTANVVTSNARMNRFVFEVLCVVPPEVAAFALRRCRFVTLRPIARGLALEPERRPRWVIVLDGAVPLYNAHSIVAHEVAHAWLRHGNGDRAADERAASDLVASWGFTGTGADGDRNATLAVAPDLPDQWLQPTPRAQWRVGHDSLLLRCGYCQQDADLHAPAFDLPDVLLVARCPSCQWLHTFVPALDCPTCGKVAAASWKRGWWGRRLRWLQVKHADPPRLRLRCRACRHDAVLRVALAPRAAMLAPPAEAAS